MRLNRQAPYPFKTPGNVSGSSGALATLILLLLILIVIIFTITTVGNKTVSTGDDISHFRVWGTENSINASNKNSPDDNITITYYNASVVSVDLPMQMTHGDSYLANITMRNTGIANWYADGGNPVTLAAVGNINGDAYRFTMATCFTMRSGTVVRKGETYAFRYNIAAPLPGQYLPEFQMSCNDAGGFGEIACKSIKIVAGPTPTPSPAPIPTHVPIITPTPVPTIPPYQAYVAYGKFTLLDRNGKQMIGGPWYWVYDGPFGSNNLRSSYFSEPSWPYPDWDIGGPGGQYHVYKEGCIGSGSFSMNNGGDKGTITFRFIN